jgi:GNAT superfamily N-acetyltransferase
MLENAPMLENGMTFHPEEFEYTLGWRLDAYIKDPFEKTIGTAFCEVNYLKIATLQTILVQPKWRRNGIGSILLQYAQNWAGKKGATRIETDIVPLWGTQEEVESLLRKHGWNVSDGYGYKELG